MESITVLLVDDEERFVTSNAKLLNKLGFRVLTAMSGDAAIQILESNDVDVAVVDVKMPGMDGITLLTVMKKRFPLVEVVMLTGNATFESAVSGLKIGASDYLMKPADLDELVLKIREANEKRKIQLEKTRPR
ncbi:MAG: response regulator [Thermodesulfobacteriota bacterium]